MAAEPITSGDSPITPTSLSPDPDAHQADLHHAQSRWVETHLTVHACSRIHPPTRSACSTSDQQPASDRVRQRSVGSLIPFANPGWQLIARPKLGSMAHRKQIDRPSSVETQIQSRHDRDHPMPLAICPATPNKHLAVNKCTAIDLQHFVAISKHREHH
ncbi:hypothetical protein ACLOJK_018970 [Asimina triloba]